MANEPHRGVGQCPSWKSFCWLIGVVKIIDEAVRCMSEICRKLNGKQEIDRRYATCLLQSILHPARTTVRQLRGISHKADRWHSVSP